MGPSPAILLLLLGGAAAAPRVHNIEPRYISKGGGIVFIYGAEFSGDSFAAFNPNPDVGNKIWFYNDYETISCTYPVTKTWLLQNPQDSAGTTKLVCSLPARRGKTGSDWYTLKVTCDGNEVENAHNHMVKYDDWRTPKLRKIEPRYGKPGGLVTLHGRIISKNIGPGGSDLDNFDEMDTTTLQSIMFASSNCELMSDLGNPHGVALKEEGEGDTRDGNVTCKTTGSFIGALNASLFVSGVGMSVIERDALSVNSKGQAFFYHTLPEVTSIGPNTGSSDGGTFINLEGLGFDGYKDNTKVYVNDALCEMVEIDSTSLTCKAPAEADVGSADAGSRGLTYHLWKDTELEGPDMGASLPDDSEAEEFFVDQGFIDMQMSDEQFGYTGRLSGLFEAPNTGNFKFMVCSNDFAELYLGTSSDSSTKALIASKEGACANGKPSKGDASEEVAMVEGELYYIEAVHRHGTDLGNITNFVQISIYQSNTVLNNGDLSLADDENQGIYIKDTRVLEQQKITIEGDVGEFTFSHMGRPSQTPVFADDHGSWPANLMTMFSWQCTKDQTQFTMVQSAEEGTENLIGQGGTDYRKFGGGSEPFCGRKSWWKPWRIFRRNGNWDQQYLDMSSDGKYFCFAHKGSAYNGGINMLVQFDTIYWSKRWVWVNFGDLSDGKDGWQYKCFNLQDEFEENASQWVLDQFREGGKLKLKEINIPYDSNPRKDGYLDEVSLGKKEVNIERVAPAFDNTAIRMDEITVSKNDSILTFNPYTCQAPEDTMHLLGVFGATIEEMSTSATGQDLAMEQKEFLASNDKATFVVGGGKVIVERLAKESPKMEGTFSLTYQGETIDGIPTDISFDRLQEMFEAKFNLFGIEMSSYHQAHDECYDFHQSWTFKYIGGDQPEIEIDTSNVINHGTDFSSGVWTGRDGGVMIVQPGGDFFRLPAQSGQRITVNINGFWSSIVEGVDNSFSYDSSLTPTITGVADAIVDGNIELTISGTGFTDDPTDFSIMVGDRACEATTASASSVTCILENGPAGDFDIEFFVKSKGKATGSVTFTLGLSVVSLSPTSGSVGGGTTLTVTGTGFPATMDGWENGQVTIGGNECEILETDYTQLKCITPPEDNGGRKRRALASLEITLNGQTASGSSYNYDSSSTPTLTTLDPVTSSPAGGEVLTITGTSLGWGYGVSSVNIGGQDCPKITWVDTEITCTMPPLPNGHHKVIVEVNGNGYADNSGVPQIAVDFTITGASPRVGSHQGGTKMKIFGSGFGDCSQVVFNIGDGHTCEVNEGGCEDTEAYCTVTKSGTLHKVQNTGRHFKFGPGYMWEPKSITIRPGEQIRWSWNLPAPGEGTGIAVHQVEFAGSNDYDGKGFNSGDKMAKGNYIHQFDTEGTFYYSTQDVIEEELVFMTGSVTVAAPAEDEIVAISATYTGGIEAEAIPGGSPTGPAAGACAFASTACASEGGDLEFTFANCLTPEVTGISVTSGQATNGTESSVMSFASAELTISGSGFGAVACENSVKVGDGDCAIMQSSEDTIVCNTDPNAVTSQDKLPIVVNVLNNGNAVMKIPDDTGAKLYVVPKIDSISPVTGSWAGGAVLTISGSGLKTSDDITTVNIGEDPFMMACSIIEVLPSQISCSMPDFRSYSSGLTEKEVTVSVYLGGDQLEPRTDDGFEMKFTYSDAATSTSGAVTPAEFSASAPVTIEGTGFGSDAAAVSVFLRPSSMSGRRRRRSVESQVEELRVKRAPNMGPKPRYVHKFWKDLVKTTKRSITWASAGSSRSKRSIDDLPQVSVDEFQDEYEEDFHPEIEHVHARTVKRSVHPAEWDHDLYEEIINSEPTYFFNSAKHSRKIVKRSTAEELLEMSMEGSVEATVSAVSDTSVTFTPPELPAGSYDVIVNIAGAGNSDASGSTITSAAQADSIAPASGSIHGGQTVVISGNGFSGKMEDTTVDVGGKACVVTDVKPDAVTCVTPAGADGSSDFVVTSNGVSFPGVAYGYDAATSPTVAAVTPSSGSGPTSLSIDGSNFGAGPTVTVGGESCSVTSSSAAAISCDIAAMPGGEYPVVVTTSEYGLSNNDVKFTFLLSAASVSPASGSFGGGSLITITGQGFDTVNDPMVKICDAACTIETVSDTEITCRTPANEGSGTEVCDVVVEQVSKASATVAGGFTYDGSLTPQVTGVSPKRGGTGGGTPLTITGTGFASSGNKVFVDGSVCDITSESSTQIECTTNAHDGCIEIPVTVEVPDQGYGQHPDDGSTTYYYIDRWSSVWTWGGKPPPKEGIMAVITEGQTILLDESTPHLAGILILGGKLVFDKEANGINLQADWILIMRNGALEVGTEDDRYLNEAQITMHGNVRCTELPIYGCKVIALREGTLDLHGEFIPMTWTRLAQTAVKDDTQITLEHGVNWKPGSEIVVATTGGRASMGESEKMTIESVSADGTVITLTEPLKYEHLSIMQTFGDHDIETRAEVGLLSRNIKIKGTVNEQFITEIPACEKPFVANEEAPQSCFAGKFGEETGTDEFGATILIHGPERNEEFEYVTARISYTEFNEVGQAFRVGRYPIHFHMIWNATKSYVRGNAVHHSYNRATTLHAVQSLTVEHNVVFDIKGLSFFTEDGVEEDNVLQYNLAVYTRQSNSLLNPDIQPGSFWIVNANNIVRHNAVAGNTHFGYWYRSLVNPDGPSRTTSYCPARAPMGEFFNNSAHSCGLYGIWLFTAGEPGMQPSTGTKENGYCDGSPAVATFGDFTAWNCEIGAELVEGGAIVFENFTMLDNEKSGIELIHGVGVERQNGPEYGAPGVHKGIIVAHSKLTENWENGATFGSKTGVKSGWWGNDVLDTEFYNFDREGSAALTNCARCKPKWAAHKTMTKGLKFVNSPNKVSWRWTMSGHYHDLDGTLCGSEDCKVVQKRAIYDPAHCADDTDDEFSHCEGGCEGKDWLKLGLLEDEEIKLEGYVCDDTVKFHSVGYNAYAPSSLQFNDGIWYNEFGSSRTPWRKKPPYANGWAAVLQEGPVNRFHWYTMDHITNITYKLGAFGMAEEGDYILLGHNFTQSPDVFTFNGESANSTSSLDDIPTYETAENTNWHWSGNDTKTLSYILSHKDKSDKRKKRGGKPLEKYREIQFRVYRCLYEGCLPPPPPTVPAGRPTEFYKWSSEEDWAKMDMTKPVAGESGVVEEMITIPPGAWVVLDEVPPLLTRLYIYGVLEIGDEMDNVLSAEIILIQGDTASLIAGFSDAPHTHKFDILLRGNHTTPDQPLPNGPNLGAKALGVFGKLQLHGLDVGRTWTRLDATANAGDDTIVIEDDVDPTYWAPGAEIVIAPTGYEPTEVEKHFIKAIDGKTITLEQPLNFTHHGYESSLADGSATWKIAAEVGLLTRNVRIIGENYPGNEGGELAEEFGARVLVSKFVQEGTEYRGYAKIANVEWQRGGQEGWTDSFDPRYSLAFLNHGDSVDNDETNKESYVKKCSFNFNYNAAIGLFGTNNVLVEDTVTYRTLEYGLRDEGVGNRWIHNFIVYNVFVGIHKNQRTNFYKRGCFQLKEAWDTEFKFNAAAGCERAGISATGHICSSQKRWEGNVVHTCQDGIFTNTYAPALEVIDDKECVVFRNFFLYNIYDYAFYTLTHDTVKMENNLIVNAGVGVHPFLIRPRASTHELEEKHISINNTIFVGRSDEFDCVKDNVEPSYSWFDSERAGGATLWPGRNWKNKHNGHAGVLWPIFSGIGVPLGKPWVNGKPKSFPLLVGKMYLNNVTFANFNPHNCPDAEDYAKKDVFDSAIRTNPRGDDMQFPIIATGIKFVNSSEETKVWMDTPLDKLIVNEHCVDMHCDGLKKALLIDTDGSVIGDNIPGTIIPDAAYEWDGNPSAGLGYYRVPKTMVTEVNGDKIENEDKLPNTGIVRNDDCVWMETWRAYKCHDINHRLLIIESMDIDSLDRRLSPVAVLANPGPNGYIDLINGPQDFSCCFGYACQKRISNFYTIIGTNMLYEIHLTSTPPIHMRYRLKDNMGDPVLGNGDPVLLKIYFPKPQRIDIFVGDRFVSPNNIDLTSEKFNMLPPDDSYIPSLSSQVNGENYFDPNQGMLYLLLTGEEPVDYKIQPAVVTKIGASIDMENFFEEDVIGNIAALLGIDPANIQLTEIVREGSVRRKRHVANANVDITMRAKKKKKGKNGNGKKSAGKKPATTTQAPTTSAEALRRKRQVEKADVEISMRAKKKKKGKKGNSKKPAGRKPATTTQAPTTTAEALRRKRQVANDDVEFTMRAKKKKKGKKGKGKKPAGKKPATKKPATTTQAPTTTAEAYDGPEEVTLVFTIEPPPVTNLTEPENTTMSYNDLNVAMAQLTTAFQDGSMGSALGLNLTSVEMQAPIHVPSLDDLQCNGAFPQEEDPEGECYFGPEENVQSGTSWADASQANASALLEASLEFDTLAVPETLVLVTEPNGAFEMMPFSQQPKLYLLDSDGKFVNVVGGDADPWIVTATVASGPGGDVVNNVTAPFLGGFATFENLAIDLGGSDYILGFAITYPDTVTISSVNSTSFDVGGRPLSIKITAAPDLTPAGLNFSMAVTVWDDALDAAADQAITDGLSGLQCTISLVGATTEISGSLINSSPVGGLFSYDDLIIADAGDDITVKAICDDGGDFLEMDSVTMNVHDWPKSGLAKKASTSFSYTGEAQYVADILSAFQAVLAEANSTAPAAGRRKRFADNAFKFNMKEEL